MRAKKLHLLFFFSHKQEKEGKKETQTEAIAETTKTTKCYFQQAII